jgi:hypothetical protein
MDTVGVKLVVPREYGQPVPQGRVRAGERIGRTREERTRDRAPCRSPRAASHQDQRLAAEAVLLKRRRAIEREAGDRDGGPGSGPSHITGARGVGGVPTRVVRSTDIPSRGSCQGPTVTGFATPLSDRGETLGGGSFGSRPRVCARDGIA